MWKEQAMQPSSEIWCEVRDAIGVTLAAGETLNLLWHPDKGHQGEFQVVLLATDGVTYEAWVPLEDRTNARKYLGCEDCGRRWIAGAWLSRFQYTTRTSGPGPHRHEVRMVCESCCRAQSAADARDDTEFVVGDVVRITTDRKRPLWVVVGVKRNALRDTLKFADSWQVAAESCELVYRANPEALEVLRTQPGPDRERYPVRLSHHGQHAGLSGTLNPHWKDAVAECRAEPESVKRWLDEEATERIPNGNVIEARANRELKAGEVVTAKDVEVVAGGTLDKSAAALVLPPRDDGETDEAYRARLSAEVGHVFAIKLCAFCGTGLSAHDPTVPFDVPHAWRSPNPHHRPGAPLACEVIAHGKVHTSCAAQLERRIATEKATKPMLVHPDPYAAWWKENGRDDALDARATLAKESMKRMDLIEQGKAPPRAFSADQVPKPKPAEPHPWNSEDAEYAI
jgi:hypothetical protein